MWESFAGGLVGGLLGAGGAVGSAWLAHHLKDRRTRRAIAGAFAGEIGAMCSIIRRRKYLEHARQFLTDMSRTQQPIPFVVSITQDYLTIYRSNANEIGLLPAQSARDVAQFYTQVKALMEDVRPDSPWPKDADGATERLNEFISLLRETLAIGDRLGEELAKATK